MQHICLSTNTPHLLPPEFPAPSGCLTRPPNPFLPQLVLERTQRALVSKFPTTFDPIQHQLKPY